MRRRSFIKGTLGTAGVAAAGFRLPLVHAADYRGMFFVFVQADGGWDPTSFCDPKVNQKGEEIINHWAEGLDEDDVPQAGNIRYAPFANNKAFFENHYDKMLVINGVDAQTNAHSAGIVHNWSGRISEGYPTTTALLAANYGIGLAVPYLSFGGFSNTSGLVRYTRIDNPDLLRNVSAPAVTSWDPNERYLSGADWADLGSYRVEVAELAMSMRGLLPMGRENRRFYRSAFANAEGLEEYAAAIPPRDELKEPVDYASPSGNSLHSALERQAQLTVLAFKTGVAVSADLWLGGFDTHGTHDPDHEWLLEHLTDGVDYLWEYAEEHGIANRMVVVVGSDFGRTNKYNSQEGKDHWPIGSFVVMQKDQSWTNRVVGVTDELHFARQKFNPVSLQQDDNGTIIHPKHVHKALRRYLGIEDSPGASRFPFNATEDFAFFS